MRSITAATLVVAAFASGYVVRGYFIEPGRVAALDAPAKVGSAAVASPFASRSSDGEASFTRSPSAANGVAVAPLHSGSVRDAPPPPPAGTRVTAVLAALQDAADHGDPKAACRVGVELIRCGHTAFYVKMFSARRAALEPRAASNPKAAEMLQMIARDEDRLKADIELCEDVPEEQSRDGWRYLLQSAIAGNVAAMSKFVRDPGLPPNQAAAAADGWMAYARYAPDFLDAAIAGGDVNALSYGSFVHFTGQSTGGQGVFRKDVEKALAYGTAALPLLSGELKDQLAKRNARMAAELGTTASDRAAADGEQLRRRSFADAAVQAPSNDSGAIDPLDCSRR